MGHRKRHLHAAGVGCATRVCLIHAGEDARSLLSLPGRTGNTREQQV